MTQKPTAFGDTHSAAQLGNGLDAVTHPSGAILKASVIAPRDIIDELPEELLRWLHEDLESTSMARLASRHASRVDFESIVIDRLFPLRDARPFVNRLRIHCHATAVAAGVLADMTRHSSKAARVCGWLHDIGLASCMRHADEVMHIADDSVLELLWPTIERSSAQHALRLASRWRLPSSIRHAIRDHASYAMFVTNNPLASITYVAEHVAVLIECDFHGASPVAALERARSVLSLSERDLVSVAARVEKVMRHAHSEASALEYSQQRA
ncbi:MAG TPA: HDOD domain-containing protein [Polyangiaceae bacterium]